MFEKSIIVSGHAVWIEVYGDLLLRASESDELVVHTNNERDLRLEELGDRIEIQCTSDCQVHVPAGAREVVVRHARRDVEVMQLSVPLRAEHVKGDFTLGECPVVTIGTVGGDCQLQNVKELSISTVGGDCHIRSVEGNVICESVGGDLMALELYGGLVALAGGDILANCCDDSEKPVKLTAGGDIQLKLIDSTGASLSATSGGHTIFTEWDGEQDRREQALFKAVLGDGKRAVLLTAGGDISLSDTSPDPEGTSANPPRDRWMGKLHRKSQKAIRKAEVHLDRVSRRAEREQQRNQESLRRAESRLQAAMQRVENRPPSVTSAPRPGSAAPAVTSEEKLLVLQMLQEKKITIEEADRLLQALAGPSN